MYFNKIAKTVVLALMCKFLAACTGQSLSNDLSSERYASTTSSSLSASSTSSALNAGANEGNASSVADRALFPSDIISDIHRWKISLPVDGEGRDSSAALSVNDRNVNSREVAGESLLAWDYSPYFYAKEGEVYFRAHCAGATTSGSKYPRSELRQRVAGGDNYWSMNDYQHLSVDLRITHTPVIKPEVSVVQIHGPVNEPLRVQFHLDKGLYIVWNEVNKEYIPDLAYGLGDRLRVDITVNKGDIALRLENLMNAKVFTKTWAANDATGYFKVGVYTQSSIFLDEFKPEYIQGEALDAYGEVAISRLDLAETYTGEPKAPIVQPLTLAALNAFFDTEGDELTLSNGSLTFDAMNSRYVSPKGNGWRHEMKLKNSLRTDFSAAYEHFEADIKVDLSDGAKTIISQTHGSTISTLMKVYVADTSESGFSGESNSVAYDGVFDVFVRLRNLDGTETKTLLGAVRSGDQFHLKVINNFGNMSVSAFGKTAQQQVMNDKAAYFKFGNYLQAQNPETGEKAASSDVWEEFYRALGVNKSVVVMSNVYYSRHK